LEENIFIGSKENIWKKNFKIESVSFGFCLRRKINVRIIQCPVEWAFYFASNFNKNDPRFSVKLDIL